MSMRRFSPLIASATALALLLPLAIAAGQQPPPAKPPATAGSKPAKSDKPAQQYDIQADNGIEWDKDRMVYIARGNARVIRGDRMIRAPLITAFYRIGDKNKNEVFKVDAEGGVKVAFGDDTAEGDRGVYNLDSKVFILTGKNLVYNTQDARVTARDSLEYHDDSKVAIARGNGYVVREYEWIKGDVLTAFFEETREKRKPKPATPGGAPAPAAPAKKATTADPAATDGSSDDDMVTKQKLVRIEGAGHVIINSCDGIGRGDKMVYFPDTGEARLEGNVRLTRGEMQMQGARAEMNTRTQFMRMLPGPDGKQVAGTFYAADESFKPDNIPFEAGGIDPCKDRTKQTPGATPAPKAADSGKKK